MDRKVRKDPLDLRDQPDQQVVLLDLRDQRDPKGPEVSLALSVITVNRKLVWRTITPS